MKIFSLTNLTTSSLVVKPFVSPKSRISPLEMKLCAKWKESCSRSSGFKFEARSHGHQKIRISGYKDIRCIHSFFFDSPWYPDVLMLCILTSWLPYSLSGFNIRISDFLNSQSLFGSGYAGLGMDIKMLHFMDDPHHLYGD